MEFLCLFLMCFFKQSLRDFTTICDRVQKASKPFFGDFTSEIQKAKAREMEQEDI
jgi:hypothetical protein